MATTFRNENLFCLKCGGEFKIKYPIATEKLLKKIRAFDELHFECEQTWTEPEADQKEDWKKRALWWISNGRTGMSSKTIWNCLIGNKDFPINHPHDPSDFGRCYDLLKAVPEWRSELHKLSPLSKYWSRLVDNWDELTRMYEENEKEEWKNCEKIGMYEFMQKILESK